MSELSVGKGFVTTRFASEAGFQKGYKSNSRLEHLYYGVKRVGLEFSNFSVCVLGN